MTATRTASPYEACEALFANYPLAVEPSGHGIRSMALLVPEGDQARFFALIGAPGAGSGPHYDLLTWQAGDAARVTPAGGVPAWVPGILSAGVPLPRDGSMFGYAVGDEVTAVILSYGYEEDHPDPSWSVMPRAGVHRDLWPPFTGERLLGHWFWDMARDGRLVDLGPVVAETSGTVYWVPLSGLDGCVAVTRDVAVPSGEAFPAGLYANWADLEAGVRLPDGLEGATDLGPRFTAGA